MRQALLAGSVASSAHVYSHFKCIRWQMELTAEKKPQNYILSLPLPLLSLYGFLGKRMPWRVSLKRSQLSYSTLTFHVFGAKELRDVLRLPRMLKTI